MQYSWGNNVAIQLIGKPPTTFPAIAGDRQMGTADKLGIA